jgi:hypothetical protein
MKFHPRHLVVVCLLLAAGSAIGCAKGTYLQVNFTGGGLPEIRGIAVELTLTDSAGVVTHSRGKPLRREGNDPKITLPTSAAFVLDSESGTLTINASALGIEDQVVATASSETTTIMHGKTWVVVVDFGGTPIATGPDGGN